MSLVRPPVFGKSKPNEKRVLIYGGSSSCGQYAVKYASDAGYEVVTTSSPDRKEIFEKHNPMFIIDHTLPCKELAKALNVHGPYEAIFDTIGTPPVTDVMIAMLAQQGGQYHSTLPLMEHSPVPTNIQRNFASYASLLDNEENEEIRKWLFEEYVPEGLKNGQIISTRITVKENGLKSIQEVLDSILSARGKDLLWIHKFR